MLEVELQAFNRIYLPQVLVPLSLRGHRHPELCLVHHGDPDSRRHTMRAQCVFSIEVPAILGRYSDPKCSSCPQLSLSLSISAP